MENKICLSIDQLAEQMGIGRVNAYELARTQGFPSIKVGKRILIPVASLERWLEEQAGAQKGATA